jgi:predicted short-subunit dehydrogenase-like oxidoreductase (DUF2520 family)
LLQATLRCTELAGVPARIAALADAAMKALAASRLKLALSAILAMSLPRAGSLVVHMSLAEANQPTETYALIVRVTGSRGRIMGLMELR